MKKAAYIAVFCMLMMWACALSSGSAYADGVRTGVPVSAAQMFGKDEKKAVAPKTRQSEEKKIDKDDRSLGVALLIACIAGYFLPWMIAKGRGHGSSMGIFFLNLFLGWTLVGWVVALSWSGSKT